MLEYYGSKKIARIPMRAIIEVKKGEVPYKIIRSPLLKDSEGPILFKLLSKKCLDGKIEAVYVTERRGGKKTILGRTIVEEEKFMDAVNAFRFAIWRFFPKVDLEIEDMKLIDAASPRGTSQYFVAKNTKSGLFWMKIKKWMGI